MTRPNRTRAPKGAAGTCSRNRRRQRAARRPDWVRSYRRAQQALDAVATILFSTMHVVETYGRCAERRPIRTARLLTRAIRRMASISVLLFEARRELAEAREFLGQAPDEQRGDAPEILALAAERCQAVAKWFGVACCEVLLAQADVLEGLATGELVPERPSDNRPRIILAPRPVPVRAFLAARLPRVGDRITPVLLRRRRTPHPAEVRVPRRHHRGRAPPLSPICAL